jgi:hypothetical protein
MTPQLSPKALYAIVGLPDAPVVVDLRGADDCAGQPRIIPGALRRDAGHVRDWIHTIPRKSQTVLYSNPHDQLGSTVADELNTLGHHACRLEGDLDAWLAAGFPTVKIRGELRVPGGSRWVTRERPKIDRLACPWLVRRFIDTEAQFFYTPSHRVRVDARSLGAEPYDIPEVTFSHRGPRCTFDAFLDEFELNDPVLTELAQIIRAADTGLLDQSREAAGLLAISIGLSANMPDDILLMEHAMSIYDALYAWRKKASHETHSWPQPSGPGSDGLTAIASRIPR